MGTVSLEQLVIDDDLYGHLHRHMQGMVVSEETLATEGIADVGPGQGFLMKGHTLAHFREEHYCSALASRLNAPAWAAGGGRDVVNRAGERVREILAAPVESHLSAAQLREIAEPSARAEKALLNLKARI